MSITQPISWARPTGAIIGTSLKRDGVISNPIDPERVKRMAQIIRGLG